MVGVVGLEVWREVRAGDGDGRLGWGGTGGHVGRVVADRHRPGAVAGELGEKKALLRQERASSFYNLSSSSSGNICRGFKLS